MNIKNPVNVLAIDGGEASGKSSTAKKLASRLGIFHLNSGLFYRMITYLCLARNIKPENVAAVMEIVEDNIHRFKIRDGIAYFDGEKVGAKFQIQRISTETKYYAEIPEVRAFLRPIQRSCINPIGLIAEGRDMGSVVFPDAALKIFLTASAETRAKRRYEELIARGEKVTYQKVLADLIARDKLDSERECCPLVRAPDATLIETDRMDLDGVVRLIQDMWLLRTQGHVVEV